MAERKYHFERLTPIDNIDLDVYEDAINYVFKNPDVKNVAISGAYSAGKSLSNQGFLKNSDRTVTGRTSDNGDCKKGEACNP